MAFSVISKNYLDIFKQTAIVVFLKTHCIPNNLALHFKDLKLLWLISALK